ncbi:MAG: oligosaccharide flippase family protein [Deltaproteobacteria bacterium]|nr:oligosaccharide flippase family protein [Deltaproteobacteria bacterium]
MKEPGSLKKELLSGGAWVIAGKGFSAFFSLAVNVLLARVLSPTEYGAYFLALSMVSLVAISGQFGLNRIVVRLVAEALANSRPGKARGSIRIVFFIGIFSIICIAAFAIKLNGFWLANTVFHSSELASVMHLAFFWCVVLGLQGLVSETFRGFHDIRLATVFGGLVTATVSFFAYLVIFLLIRQANLGNAIMVAIGAGGFSLLLAVALLAQKTHTLGHAEPCNLGQILRMTFPLFLTSLSIFALREMHLWILGAFRNEAEVALFGACHRLMNMISIPLLIVNAVIPPKVAELFARGDKVRLERMLRTAATISSIPALLVFFVLLFWSSEVLSLVFGNYYEGGTIVLLIMAAAHTVNVLSGSPGVLLIMSGNEKIIMNFSMFSGVLGLMMTYFSIPRYGFTGAAAGVALSLVGFNGAAWFYCRYKLNIRTHLDVSNLQYLLKNFRF